MIEVAAVLIGAGFLFSYSSRNNKMKAELLDEATPVNTLKGLAEFLEKKPFNDTVVVYGTVGSTSPIATKHSKALGVFVQDAASIMYEKMERVGFPEEWEVMTLKRETTLINRQDVPWYLEDGTAQVNVSDYKYAKGFADILRRYFYRVHVREHFERLLSVKEVKIYDPNWDCECCETVLEIGTPVTIVGRAERDKDGVPMIQRVYQFFNERIELKEEISELESNSVSYGNFSLFCTAVGMVFLVVSVLSD